MNRWKRAAICCTVSALAFALVGCDIQWVNVMIPDFQSKQVQGVWIWYASGATGTFAHQLQVPVQTVFAQIGPNPTPGVLETASDPAGNQQMLVVNAQPDPANPDGITVKIGVVAPTVSGYVKVSTYNVAGESPISSAEASF